MTESIVWLIFIVVIGLLMAIDLGVFNKKAHIPNMAEALVTSSIWVLLGLSFSFFIYGAYEHHWFGLGSSRLESMDGWEAALKYLTGYLLELSLSIDNLFVMALVFAQLQVPRMYQHRILFWGIIGVIVFRGLLIAVGIALVHRFESLFYVFGALLLYSAWKMLRHRHGEDTDVHDHIAIRMIKRFYPVTRSHFRGRFFAREQGRPAVTPLFVALLVVETTDIMFAFDSVPAVFSITTDPFLVFSSNIFAILGLRSLYFLLANVLDRFIYLKYSLIAILFYIGIKMILIPLHIYLPIGLSLGIIAGLLVLGIVFSLYSKPKISAEAKI
ncbi:MAG: TerC family protein [Saprospiraceae bacterium]|nr:TerC family protein [Saprospiraceae bacterium]